MTLPGSLFEEEFRRKPKLCLCACNMVLTSPFPVCPRRGAPTHHPQPQPELGGGGGPAAQPLLRLQGEGTERGRLGPREGRTHHHRVPGGPTEPAQTSTR